jgi:hypothetical protein
MSLLCVEWWLWKHRLHKYEVPWFPAWKGSKDSSWRCYRPCHISQAESQAKSQPKSHQGTTSICDLICINSRRWSFQFCCTRMAHPVTGSCIAALTENLNWSAVSFKISLHWGLRGEGNFCKVRLRQDMTHKETTARGKCRGLIDPNRSFCIVRLRWAKMYTTEAVLFIIL